MIPRDGVTSIDTGARTPHLAYSVMSCPSPHTLGLSKITSDRLGRVLQVIIQNLSGQLRPFQTGTLVFQLNKRAMNPRISLGQEMAEYRIASQPLRPSDPVKLVTMEML